MGAADLLRRCLRCRAPVEIVKRAGFETSQNGRESLRLFGMSGRRHMTETGGVREQSSAHRSRITPT